MKGEASNSWFTYVQQILHKYELPNAHSIIADPLSKKIWKNLIQQHIIGFWDESSRTQVASMNSLRYLSMDSLALDHPALVWNNSSCSRLNTERALWKVKLMTGTYRLQTHECLFNKGHARLQPTCKLCETEAEDRLHFITRCPALRFIRQPYLGDLEDILQTVDINLSSLSDELLLAIILDVTNDIVPSPLRTCSVVIDRVESLSRNMLYHLHVTRWRILQDHIEQQP